MQAEKHSGECVFAKAHIIGCSLMQLGSKFHVLGESSKFPKF